MSSEFFTKIEGGAALLRRDGIFKQAPLYHCDDGKLYARSSGGFIRILKSNETSQSAISYQSLKVPFELGADMFKNPVMPGSTLDLAAKKRLAEIEAKRASQEQALAAVA